MFKIRKTFLSPVALFCVLFTIFSSCNQKKEKPCRSFCYWKTDLYMSSEEEIIKNKIGVNHFYLRYFDVDWNPFQREALPIGTINSIFYGYDAKATTITPCVFITNIVMENATKQQLTELAQRIKSRIETVINSQAEYYSSRASDGYSDYNYRDSVINKDSLKIVRDSVEKYSYNEFGNRITEILIDCDWTEKTKDKYFTFLKELKELSPQYTISATVRLWQYKDKKTAGIPPVDRCLLMCYNLNSPTQYNQKNSICSLEELKKYISGDSYPLSMDVALPIFNSGVIFRNGTFKGMLSNINISDYENDTLNYQRIKDKLYRFKTEQVIGNTLIRDGDQLRIEQLTEKELTDIANFLCDKLKLSNDNRLTFFSWDTTYINNYGVENIKKYYTLFNH